MRFRADIDISGSSLDIDCHQARDPALLFHGIPIPSSVVWLMLRVFCRNKKCIGNFLEPTPCKGSRYGSYNHTELSGFMLHTQRQIR